MLRHVLPLLAGLCLLLNPTPSRAADKPDAQTTHKNVGVDEFEKLTKEPNTVILDVRTPKEYAAGHLKGAVLLDYQAKDFEEKAKGLDRSKTYLVHCAAGGRSEKASSRFDALKFPKVYNLEGGFKAWEKAGKPVEK